MTSETQPRRLTTVLWDFDGTLADTRYKNFRVTQKIVPRVTGRDVQDFPLLQSFDAYVELSQRVSNWRVLYLEALGLTERETDVAGALWTTFQLEDDTPSPCYAGIPDVLRRLDHVPHGIVSQNGSAFIASVLRAERLTPYFQHIIGYEDVGFDRQKPHPDGLLLCLDALTRLAPGLAVFVGDHETDAKCAANANHELRRRGIALDVVSVGAFFHENGNTGSWAIQPDHRVASARDILDIVTGLA